MKNFLLVSLALYSISQPFTVQAEPVSIDSGNVIGDPLFHEVTHHLLQSQWDFAKLVSHETNGEVELTILVGKRKDIPVFRMPAMTAEGSLIQACAVPSFFLPKVSELKVFEIPYLFRDKAHAAKYPTSEAAAKFTTRIEEEYGVKVLGHFLVAYHVSIASTDKPIVNPEDFAGRHVNDGFESFGPMWVNIEPARRYDIGFSDAVKGGLHAEEQLDTTIGMLQNAYVQKQYTKFNYSTVAPGFYTFFYTFMINRDIWGGLTEGQQAGVLRAADSVQKTAFANEQSTAIYHQALNAAMGMQLRRQTQAEREAWAAEFSDKVRDGILESSENPQVLEDYINMIKGL